MNNDGWKMKWRLKKDGGESVKTEDIQPGEEKQWKPDGVIMFNG